MFTEHLTPPNVAHPSTGPIPPGFVMMCKAPEPDGPWRFVSMRFNGCVPKSINEILIAQQGMVGGFIEGMGRPYPSFPYRLVCNEEGMALGMPHCLTLRGGLSLVGPVLFVACRKTQDGWMDTSMDVSNGTDIYIRALKRMLGGCPNGIKVAGDRLRGVDVIAPKVREAVHA